MDWFWCFLIQLKSPQTYWQCNKKAIKLHWVYKLHFMNIFFSNLQANYTVAFPSHINRVIKKQLHILSSNKLLHHLLGHADSDQWRSLYVRARAAAWGFSIWFLLWWQELLADWLALQNVLTSVLLLPCPYFLRSGLLWHGLTLRLADWLSSPLANDGSSSLSSSCTSPTLPPSLFALLLIIWAAALDTTRKFHRFCWCSQWVMAMRFIASANVFGFGSEQGASTCRIEAFPVVSFQIQKCSLLHAYMVWLNNMVVLWFCKGAVEVSVMSWCLSSARLLGSDRRQVDRHWESWMWVINWKWRRDVKTSLLQSTPLCLPYIVKTGSVWMFQHGGVTLHPPPSAPITTGLLIQLDRFHSIIYHNVKTSLCVHWVFSAGRHSLASVLPSVQFT